MATIEFLLQALARQRDGDGEAAASLCQTVLDDEPEQPVALHLLGVLALRDGRAADAVGLLRRALDGRPDNGETLAALAEALMTAGSPGDSVPLYRRILAARPDHAPALAGLAVALLRTGSAAAAEAAGADAVAADPRRSASWFAHGSALSALGRPEAAIAALRRAATLDPTHACTRLNLGNAHADCDEMEAAETHLRAALALDPALPEAHASLGWLLAGTGRLGEAVACCTEAIRLRPGFAEAHWNRAFAHLLAGDFGRGWVDYEWRKRHDAFAAAVPALPGPQWQGEALSGRRLLVHAEQGLGDTIQLARYLPVLAARGAAVTLACAPTLIPLLRQLPATLAPKPGPLPPHDLWVDQMSLPRLFGTTPATIPAASGYLRADAAPRPAGTHRVGLVWSGNPAHSNDRRRSMPTAALTPLLAVQGVDFVSLQVGPRAAEITTLFGLADNSPALPDFAATARLVASLDLVIAVDTATAHLAGALGVPVWIMLPAAPDWRWMTGRDDSPWYASARLFRQTKAGEWATVIRRVAEELRQRWR